MESPLTGDDDIRKVEDEIRQEYERANRFFQERDHISALQITEKLISVHGKNKSKSCGILHSLEGTIFSKLARETENNYVKGVYLLSALESNFKCSLLFPGSLECIRFCANLLFDLGEKLESTKYYETAVDRAKQGLTLENPQEMPEYRRDLPSGTQGSLNHRERIKDLKKELEKLINSAKEKTSTIPADTMVNFRTPVDGNESNSRLARELQERGEMKKNAERLGSIWADMHVKGKKDFMKVSIEELKCYVERLYGSSGKEALERGLLFAKENRRWKLWKCGICSEEFRDLAECERHLEKEHATKYETSPKDVIPSKADEIWTEMICAVDWEPVNTVAAVEMIKNQLADVKEFVYVKGWSKDWPLADDENRRNILKTIQQSLLKHKILSRSIRDWMLHYTSRELGLLQCYLEDSGLARTPQCICFLECSSLERVLSYFRLIETDIIESSLSKAVDAFWESSRVKERIDFDEDFSRLLLDKELLRGKVDGFDDEGTVSFRSSSNHCARVSPQGDEIISWLLDCPPIDERFEFHRPIREHNLDILLAVLRITECRCRKLETRYKKKLHLTAYDSALIEAKELCAREDEWRRNVPNDQWNTYASILCNKCEELVSPDLGIPDAAIPFLSVVRDVLEEATSPRYGVSEMKDFQDIISHSQPVKPNDDSVLGSLEMLKTLISDKIPLIDLKILMMENSRNQLLNDLTRLSIFDYRSFILPLLKRFLREELEEMRRMEVRVMNDTAIAAVSSAPDLAKKKKTDNEDLQN